MKYLENSDHAVVKDVMEVDATPRITKADSQADGGNLVSEVAEGVASLPTLEREALVFSEYEGLGLGEIAAIVGVDVETVAARLESAHQRLRNVLASRPMQ